MFIERFEEEMINSEMAYRLDVYQPGFMNTNMYGASNEV